MVERNDKKYPKVVTYVFKRFPKIDGEYVKRLRNKLGLTQWLFAELMHVSIKTVEKWEQGKNPVTNGNAVAMVLFERNPSLVNEFIEENSEWLATHYVRTSPKTMVTEKETSVKELKPATAK